MNDADETDGLLPPPATETSPPKPRRWAHVPSLPALPASVQTALTSSAETLRTLPGATHRVLRRLLRRLDKLCYGHLGRLAWAGGLFSALVFALWLLPNMLNPTPPSREEKRRNSAWVSTSPYWADRQACRWLGLCGFHHVRWDDPVVPRGGSRGDELKAVLEVRTDTSEYPEYDDAAWLWRESLGQESWEIAGSDDGDDGDDGDDNGSDNATTARRSAHESLFHSAPHPDVPQYVLDHAPLVHLFSGEHFWPSHIGEHMRHMVPFTDGAAINTSAPLSLDKVYEELNNISTPVYLTSEVDVETRPAWLHSEDGIPAAFPAGSYNADRPEPRVIAELRKRVEKVVGDDDVATTFVTGHKPDDSGRSSAPAILVLVDKGDGIVDAFWFFFYSYNLGQTVLKVRYGNHVGDWEHCMIRFEHGTPRALFISEHAGGQAYAWEALEKMNTTSSPVERPVIYSAVGSHAMYALPGQHAYVLPFKMLRDETDRGPLWDPAKNNLAYVFDAEGDQHGGGAVEDVMVLAENEGDGLVGRRRPGTQPPASLKAASKNADAPTSWFHLRSPWGDETYELGDARQWRLFGQYHYITGPQGPKFKNLGRSKVCQTKRCRILYSLDAGKKASWYS